MVLVVAMLVFLVLVIMTTAAPATAMRVRMRVLVVVVFLVIMTMVFLTMIMMVLMVFVVVAVIMPTAQALLCFLCPVVTACFPNSFISSRTASFITTAPMPICCRSCCRRSTDTSSCRRTKPEIPPQ